MALTAVYNLEALQLDTINAFLNSPIDEEIYRKCPPGYENLGKGLKLVRALYGLCRAPKLWYEEFIRTLDQLGLKPILGQPCLFTNGLVILFFYMDDISLLGWSMDALQSLKKGLISRYEMRDLGPLQWFLGIRVTRDHTLRKLWLSQDAYVNKIVSVYHLPSHRPTHIPLPVSGLSPNDKQASQQQIYMFQ